MSPEEKKKMFQLCVDEFLKNQKVTSHFLYNKYKDCKLSRGSAYQWLKKIRNGLRECPEYKNNILNIKRMQVLIENDIGFTEESRKNRIKSRFNWEEIQVYYDTELPTWDEIATKFGIDLAAINYAKKYGFLKMKSKGDMQKARIKAGLLIPHKHGNETRSRISASRKKFISEHPDKHGWSNSRRNRSSWVCDYVKDYLRSLGIDFEEEYMPLSHKGRYFSADITFISKKLMIEINGRQHYEKDGVTLKPYYQTRHDLIEAEGWKVYEVTWEQARDKVTIDEILKKENLTPTLFHD